MIATDNRQWVLRQFPENSLDLSCWKMIRNPVPVPGPGQILVRNSWLSVDPYLRGKLNPAAKAMTVGDVMVGGGAGEVMVSMHPEWKAGDLVEALNVGWSEYSVLTPGLPGPAAVNRIPTDVPMQAALHWLGMPGLTAYFGMLEIGKPRPGDVVVVSAAAGAVGQVAGQIAGLAGCRVIGIAGSEEKLAWCRSIGFDEVINYRHVPDLGKAIAALCPEGVNVFFDGTGGPIHDAVIPNLAIGARVVICGKIAVADLPASKDIGLRSSAHLIMSRATVQGMVVFDWWHRRDEAVARLSNWYATGKLKVCEDIAEGIEAVPTAFLRLMAGENVGKQLIKL